MTYQDLQDSIPTIVDDVTESIDAHSQIRHLDSVSLPNRDNVVAALHLLRQVVYPGYFGKQGLTPKNIKYRVGELLAEAAELLYEEVHCALRFQKGIRRAEQDRESGGSCSDNAAQVVAAFQNRMPAVRELLAGDVSAAAAGDPAAHENVVEITLCYPGVLAITVQRLAHELYKLNVPLLPRIMTEEAHSLTGIDIHPKVAIGRSFFIDHGTGVVIGETAEIGNNVRLYQGVTLGALVSPKKPVGKGKRHPTIEDNVIIFSGATILGGETVIGKGSTIYPNVFLINSVEENSTIKAAPHTVHTDYMI